MQKQASNKQLAKACGSIVAIFFLGALVPVEDMILEFGENEVSRLFFAMAMASALLFRKIGLMVSLIEWVKKGDSMNPLSKD